MLGDIPKTDETDAALQCEFKIEVFDKETSQVLLTGFVLRAFIEPHFKSKATRCYVAKHKLINCWREQFRTGFAIYQWLKPFFDPGGNDFLHTITVVEIKTAKGLR